MPDIDRLFDWETTERRQVLELWTPDEIYDLASAELLQRFYEDHRIERKPPGIRAELLAVYVCMWANTPPSGGLILIGIADDGLIEGCVTRSKELVDIERRVHSDLVREARFTTKHVPVVRSDGTQDFMLLVRVHYRDDKVVETNKHEAWIRRNNSKHLLTADERRELEIERGQVSFELEPCGLKYPDRFNIAAVKNWAANIRKIKGIDDEQPLQQILTNHRLGRIKGSTFEPNNACALLFGLDPQEVVPGCMVRFQRIEGHVAETGRERNVVRDVQITGAVPDIIDKTKHVIESQIRTYSQLGSDGKFYTAPEYPFEAWYEVVVNACAHRSYSLKGMNIFVKMFDDHLTVESPGGFPPFVTADNIYEIHHRRNWWLMDAMFYMSLVKCENEGVKRMRRAMTEMGLPEPEFQQKQVGSTVVRVTLRNNHNFRERWVDADVSAVIGQILADKLTEAQKRIVNHVAEYGQINVSQAMRLVPTTRWHTAEKHLILLRKMGILNHVRKQPRHPRSHYVLNRPE